MEIIPIIYTALFVVLVLALIVVAYSYYRFYMREKSASNKNADVVKVSIETPHQSPSYQRNKNITSQKKNAFQKIKKTSVKQSLKKIVVGKEQKDFREKDEKKVFKSNKRVKILNLENEELDQQKKHITKTTHFNKKGKTLESLGTDVLDKYSDENATDLYSIKVSESKKKSKPK